MRRVIQQDNLGCTKAACAMLFDREYDAVSITPPVCYKPGTPQHNAEVDRFLKEFGVLALRCGYTWQDILPNSSVPKLGFKYLVVVNSSVPQVMHCLAIDEKGIVFDPDRTKPDTVNLASYEINLFVELVKKR